MITGLLETLKLVITSNISGHFSVWICEIIYKMNFCQLKTVLEWNTLNAFSIFYWKRHNELSWDCEGWLVCMYRNLNYIGVDAFPDTLPKVCAGFLSQIAQKCSFLQWHVLEDFVLVPIRVRRDFFCWVTFLYTTDSMYMYMYMYSMYMYMYAFLYYMYMHDTVHIEVHVICPGANFIELLSREFCLANIFAKHFKTDYQPKYINFTCKFGWYPRKSAKQIFLVSNFLCLAALWNWPQDSRWYLELGYQLSSTMARQWVTLYSQSVSHSLQPATTLHKCQLSWITK